MPMIATTLVPGMKMMLHLADLLAKDIPAAEFGRQPAGVKMSSPAFNYGHMSLYPDRGLDLIGRPELARHDQKWIDLFAAGKECVDDPTGTVYPSMSAIMERFRARHAALVEVLAGVSDEVMMGPNPNERYRDRLPTVGSTLAFILCAHPMNHLGQVSAWRRMKGLGPVM